ncbi:MAG: hypothetical protein ACRD2U_12095 [Terriglobales bacterium]
MSELESNLNKILEEHQHESGLHVIGGRRRLIDRLVEFFEETPKIQASSPKTGKESHN